MKRILIPLALCSVSVPALSQDVVVMRRTIAPPVMSGGWSEGDWRWAGPPACTATAPRERTVACIDAGRTVSDGRCRAAKPDATGTAARYDGCTYDWRLGDYGVWSASCADPASRTRQVQCLRQDGTPATSETLCTVARPSPTDTASRLDACAWNTTSWRTPTGCGPVQQSRDVTCRDTTTNAGAVVSACQKAAAASLIVAQPAATQPATDYSTCGYQWQVGTATAWSSTCSTAATRTVTAWNCVRSDGQTVTDDTQNANRCGPKPASLQTGAQNGGCSTLVNGDFNAKTGWTLHASAFYSATGGEDGSQAVNISDSNCSEAYINQNMTAIQGSTIKISFRYKPRNYYNRTGSVLVAIKAGGNSPQQISDVLIPNGTNNAWRTLDVTTKLSAYSYDKGDKINLNVILAVGGSFSGYNAAPQGCNGGLDVMIDNVTLTAG